MTERSDHDRHMDALALRMGEVLDGETFPDVIMICAAAIAHTLSECHEEARDKMLAAAVKFIKATMNGKTGGDFGGFRSTQGNA